MSRPLGRWLAAVACVATVLPSAAQGVELLSPRDLGRWDVPPGNYSGITPIGEDRYAVVSDKEARDGFLVFRIVQDSLTGQVVRVQNEGFRGGPSALKGGRDAEGVAWTPEDSLVWISGEADQRIRAFRMDGTAAERELHVPPALGREAICPNYGFEALAYDGETGLFWTMPENAVKADGRPVAPGEEAQAALRLQSFGRDGQPRAAYRYMLDAPQTEVRGQQYAFGAVALWAVGDGRLWVMERELNVPEQRLKARVNIRIYEIRPRPEQEGGVLTKRPVAAFSSRMRLFRPPWANYEGLCEGRRLADGRRTWLLVSDSQGGYGNRFCHLRDWIRILVEQKDE